MNQIYLVTAQQQLFSGTIYKVISVEESLRLLEPLTIVGLDTETTGLDPYTKELKLLQLGCFDFQIVIDCTTINILNYKKYLESDRLFVGWNLKFDFKWLLKYKIVPMKAFDGFLAEKLMWLGYPAGIHSMSLKAAGQTYLGVELDKTVRGQIIWKKELTDEIIKYAANDVKYLEKIMNAQLKELEKKELLTAIEYENRFLFPLTYCEFCGIKLDENKWRLKMEKDLERLLTSQELLNKWVVDYCLKNNITGSSKEDVRRRVNIGYTPFDDEDYNKYLKDKAQLEAAGYRLIKEMPPQSNMGGWCFTYEGPAIKSTTTIQYIRQDLQMNLFEKYAPTPKCVINWNSAKQVIPLFEELGFDLMTKDKTTGEMKKSIDAKVIKPQKHLSSIAPIYLEYKAAQKVVSTYGENFIEQINPVSGRIHTNYQQLGADTTRITSGGKDKENRVEYINFLNFPADAETRACMVAEPGNKWISIDYSGQETFLLASIANDTAIIEELTNGSGDIHSLTAYMSYKEIPRDTPIKDIKKLYHGLRQEAKGIEFAINYGGDANTIANNKGIPIEEAQKIYNDYMSGFKGVKKYQDFCRKDVMEKGYILLNPLTGHKAYIYDYEELIRIRDKFKEPGFWEYYREMKKDDPTCNTVQEVKKFFKRKSASEKQSINYRIQGTGSMCLRVSLVNFFEYLRKNNLLFKVKICVIPYDEINVEAPEEIAEDIAKVLYNCMVKAGSYFCTRCKLDADISRLEDKTLPTYWIH